MKLSQLINDLTVLADRVGSSYDVKLRVDDDNSFGREMTNFWIEERVNDVALVADTAELILEIDEVDDKREPRPGFYIWMDCTCIAGPFDSNAEALAALLPEERKKWTWELADREVFLALPADRFHVEYHDDTP